MAKWYVLPTTGPWVAVEAHSGDVLEGGHLVFCEADGDTKFMFAAGQWQRMTKINPEPAQ